MFYAATRLRTIYASDKFSTWAVTSSSQMFVNSNNIVWWNGTKKAVVNVNDATYANVDTQSQTWYFTDKDAITVKFILSGNTYAEVVTNYGTGLTKPADLQWYNTRWYYTWMQDEFDFVTGEITEYTELYGVTECAGWYGEENGECVPQELTITFDLNGWYWTESGVNYTGNRQVSYMWDEIWITYWKTPSKLATWGTGWMFDWWYLIGLNVKWTGYITDNITV